MNNFPIEIQTEFIIKPHSILQKKNWKIFAKTISPSKAITFQPSQLHRLVSINLSNSRIIELETVKTAIEFAILLSLPEYLFLRSTPCPPNPVLRETVQVTKQHPDFI